jgi:hypothetical protein
MVYQYCVGDWASFRHAARAKFPEQVAIALDSAVDGALTAAFLEMLHVELNKRVLLGWKRVHHSFRIGTETGHQDSFRLMANESSSGVGLAVGFVDIWYEACTNDCVTVNSPPVFGIVSACLGTLKGHFLWRSWSFTPHTYARGSGRIVVTACPGRCHGAKLANAFKFCVREHGLHLMYVWCDVLCQRHIVCTFL